MDKGYARSHDLWRSSVEVLKEDDLVQLVVKGVLSFDIRQLLVPWHGLEHVLDALCSPPARNEEIPSLERYVGIIPPRLVFKPAFYLDTLPTSVFLSV